MIYILDNSDSFTYNISVIFEKLKYSTKILNYNSKFKFKNKDIICLGPGTGVPKLNKNINNILSLKHIPKIGICLGHQIICKFFGCKIKISKNVIHGDTEYVYSRNSLILNNIPKISKFCRYNSLFILKKKKIRLVSYNFYNEAMLIMHSKNPVFGIQFHPESLMSFYGIRLIKNIVLFIENYV
ncbi:aminodeoxychorismate/anthranilate synthase component II [Candidatus Vidania fulgoroideorum]